MFVVKENKRIIFQDSTYDIPEELHNNTILKIYGTATAGLNSLYGVLYESHGLSGKVLCPNNFIVSGHIIDDSKNGETVYLREQMDPANNSRFFWLISKQKILNNLNWIIVEYTDGTVFKLCPFTKYYSICQDKR